jgi:hypothetical protein
MAFRDQVAAMDAQLLDVLGDEALVDGRDLPVPGFFSAPWLQPKVGRINTGIREPVFSVRIVEAHLISDGQLITIQLTPEDGGGRYVIVRREPDGTGWVNLILREVR